MKCDYDKKEIIGDPITINTIDVKSQADVTFCFCCDDCQKKYIQENFKFVHNSLGDYLIQSNNSKIDFSSILEQNL